VFELVLTSAEVGATAYAKMSVFFGVTPQEHFDSLPLIDTSQSNAWEADARLAIENVIRDCQLNIDNLEYGKNEFDSFYNRKYGNENHYKALNKLALEFARRLKAISNKTFLAAVEKMAQFLDRNIAGKWMGKPENLESEKCCKSTDWMYALLYEMMENKPACLTSRIAKQSFSTLVYTDDCLYSGQQFAVNIRSLTCDWSYSERDCTDWDVYEKIIVAVPFMTELAWKEKIVQEFTQSYIPNAQGFRFKVVEREDSIIVTETPEARLKRHKKHPTESKIATTVIIYKPQFIPTTVYVLDEVYETMDWDDTMKKAYRAHIIGNRTGAKGAGLAFFEHRIPDGTSLRFRWEIEEFMQNRGRNIDAPYHAKHIAGLGGMTTPRPLQCEKAREQIFVLGGF
jgi:hypothetical protein